MLKALEKKLEAEKDPERQKALKAAIAALKTYAEAGGKDDDLPEPLGDEDDEDDDKKKAAAAADESKNGADDEDDEESEEEKDQKRAMIAARPDLSRSFARALMAAPLSQVRAYLKKAPVVARSTAPVLSARNSRPTLGAGAGSGAQGGAMTAERIAYREEANRAMGIQTNSKPHWEGDKWVTPFVSKAERAREKAMLAARSEAEQVSQGITTSIATSR
jgi:hypothetical protein